MMPKRFKFFIVFNSAGISYSGTACFARRTPLSVTCGIGKEEHSHEGRAITLEYPEFYLVNLYVPNAQDGLKRIDYRMIWEDDFRLYLTELDKVKPVVFCGDQPELIQRMMDEGHTLGSHSTDHICFPDTPLESCKEDVEWLHSYVKDNFNYEMSLFRFPAGEFSEKTLKLMQDMGYKSVFWSFAYRDWETDNQPDPAEALNTIVSKAHPGAIILLHSVSSTNAEILGQVIDELRAQGYEFASFEENFAEERDFFVQAALKNSARHGLEFARN